MTLNIRRDDGVAVYINGVEAARSNLSADAVYNTRAISSVGGADETALHTFTLPAAQLGLKAGSNSIAVELHQAAPNSSDVSFNLSLSHEGTLAPMDYLSMLFLRSKLTAGEFTVSAESSSDLETFQAIDSSPSVVGYSGDYEILQIIDSEPILPDQKRYLRLKVSKP